MATSRWQAPQFIEPATAWIGRQLADRGLALSGPITQPHIRPWSTVLRVPVGAEALFFKATLPEIAYEIALSDAVARCAPEQVIEILAVDPLQGWMLMADGGERAREQFGGRGDVRAWKPILAAYAKLQIRLASEVDPLLALGTPDRRPSTLHEQYRALVADERWLMIGQEGGISSEEAVALKQLAPKIEALCAELSGYTIPLSLDHSDLHDGNIFVNDSICVSDSGYRFFDWGDASISHPFFSLRTVFVSIENSYGIPEDAPILRELAEHYLQSWRDFESEANLRRALHCAEQLWSLIGALKYRALVEVLGAEGQQVASAVPALLRELLRGAIVTAGQGGR